MKFNIQNVGDLITSGEAPDRFIEIEDLTITYHPQEGEGTENVHILTGKDIGFYLLRKYNSFSLLYPDFLSPLVYFEEIFHSFIKNKMNMANWGKLYEAYTYDYNPINNYDKDSRIETEFAGKEKNELSYSGKNKSTFSTPEGGYTDTVENFRSPEDSGNYAPVEKVENKTSHREDVTESEFLNRKDTNERSFTDRKDIVTERTTGNIGVSTPADMGLKEQQFRVKNLAYQILDEFARDHFVII